MSSSPSPAAQGGGGTVHRPVAIPASPARVSDLREHTNASRSPPMTPSTPLNVPITPYSARNTPQSLGINPYLAHLAGVAANPQLGLSPSASFAQLAAMHYNPYLANALMSQRAIASTPTSSINGRHSTSRESSGNNSSPPPQASTPHRPFSPFGAQYRGEPRVATPPTPRATPLDIPAARIVPAETGGKH